MLTLEQPLLNYQNLNTCTLRYSYLFVFSQSYAIMYVGRSIPAYCLVWLLMEESNYKLFPLDRLLNETQPSLDMEINHLGLLVSRLYSLSVIWKWTHQFGNWISFHLQVKGWELHLLNWVQWKELFLYTGSLLQRFGVEINSCPWWKSEPSCPFHNYSISYPISIYFPCI